MTGWVAYAELEHEDFEKQQQQAQIQKPLLKKTLSQEYHQNILLEKAKAQEALGTKMDDLSKITKHPPNPSKYLIDKSVKHMLSPKLHGRTTGKCLYIYIYIYTSNIIKTNILF